MCVTSISQSVLNVLPRYSQLFMKAAPDQRELGAHLSVHAASSFLFRQLKYFHICVTSISMRVLQVFPLGVFNVFPSIPNFS